MRKILKSENGFTIVELMAVISILGILSTIAVSSFNRQLQDARLKKAAQAFVSFTKASKSRSMSSASPCKLIVDHEEARITISNPIECSNMGTLNLLDSSDNLENLVICGTTNTSKFNMLCNQENDGSDSDINGAPKTSTSIEFTSKGTVSKGALVKLYSPKLGKGYCIIITAPVGLIRTSRMNENICNFAE